MKMTYLQLVFIGMLTASCSGLLTSGKNEISSFDNGLQLMYDGDAYKAQRLWAILCREEGLPIACWASGTNNVEVKPSYAVIQGATDESSTQVGILVKKNTKLRFYLRDTKNGRLIKEARRQETSRSHSVWAMVQLDYQGLTTGIDYNLVVADENGQIQDSRVLRTLLVTGNKLRMAITSCQSDRFKSLQEKQWSELHALNPEVILMIGDNVYVDMKTKILRSEISPELIWDRHAETRGLLEIYRKKKLTPILATWDDHDYGLNNSGREFPHKEDSRLIFNEFFPQGVNNVLLAKGPGLSQFVRLRGQNFIFFDNRTFRTLPELKEDQVHFGEPQEQWAISLMKKHEGPFWLISGDQFFGGYHPHESYEGNHPATFSKFLAKLQDVPRRYVFVSGDRHLSEIMKIPKKRTKFQTYELTSSGIHATVFPGSFKRWPNPLQLVGVDGAMNYMIVDSMAIGGGVSFKVTAYGPATKVLYQRELQVQ